MKYAIDTKVPIAQRKGEIIADIGRFGAKWEDTNTDVPGRAIVLWASNQATPRWLRTMLLYPIAGPKVDQIQRRKWAALRNTIKSLLIAVDEGVMTFEQAFGTWIIGADGKTEFERDVDRGVLPQSKYLPAPRKKGHAA